MIIRLSLLAFIMATGFCSCGALFPECTKNSDCTSGVCRSTIDTGNRCVTGTFPGGACTSNATCASNACDAGVCACFAAGRACSSDSQCCSGSCPGAGANTLSQCACAGDGGLCP